MNISIISFSADGDKINKKLKALFLNDNIYAYGNDEELLKRSASLNEWSRNAFLCSDAIIFIGAAGIAVRAIAPFIKDKSSDPAVVVIDDKAKFVIPVLSGHLGGANRLSIKISDFLSAEPVITTATDINGVWAADLWAKENGCEIEDISMIKYISSALLRGEKIGLVCDFYIQGNLPKNVVLGENYENGIVISVFKKMPFKNTLNIIPKILNVGVGSKKDNDENLLANFFYDLMDKKNIFVKAVKGIATIDIKKNERCILSLCKSLNKELNVFSSDELKAVKGEFSSSDFVKNVTGVDNVCERAAAALGGGRLIIKKTKAKSVTAAVCCEDWKACFDNIDKERL